MCLMQFQDVMAQNAAVITIQRPKKGHKGQSTVKAFSSNAGNVATFIAKSSPTGWHMRIE